MQTDYTILFDENKPNNILFYLNTIFYVNYTKYVTCT